MLISFEKKECAKMSHSKGCQEIYLMLNRFIRFCLDRRAYIVLRDIHIVYFLFLENYNEEKGFHYEKKQ